MNSAKSWMGQPLSFFQDQKHGQIFVTANISFKLSRFSNQSLLIIKNSINKGNLFVTLRV